MNGVILATIAALKSSALLGPRGEITSCLAGSASAGPSLHAAVPRAGSEWLGLGLPLTGSSQVAAAGWEALVPTVRGECAFYFFAGFISIITVILIQ